MEKIFFFIIFVAVVFLLINKMIKFFSNHDSNPCGCSSECQKKCGLTNNKNIKGDTKNASENL